MAQLRQDPGLATEPGKLEGIGRDAGRQPLQGDVAFEIQVPDAVDASHAARADDADDGITSDVFGEGEVVPEIRRHLRFGGWGEAVGDGQERLQLDARGRIPGAGLVQIRRTQLGIEGQGPVEDLFQG